MSKLLLSIVCAMGVVLLAGCKTPPRPATVCIGVEGGGTDPAFSEQVRSVMSERASACGYQSAEEGAATKEVGGLILQTPFYSGYRFARFHAQRWSRRWGWLVMLVCLLPGGRAFPSVRFARRVRCPVLVFHGTMDSVVPYADGKELFDRIASKNKRLITVPGGGHNDFQVVMGWAKYVNEIVDFAKSSFGRNGVKDV